MSISHNAVRLSVTVIQHQQADALSDRLLVSFGDNSTAWVLVQVRKQERQAWLRKQFKTGSEWVLVGCLASDGASLFVKAFAAYTPEEWERTRSEGARSR